MTCQRVALPIATWTARAEPLETNSSDLNAGSSSWAARLPIREKLLCMASRKPYNMYVIGLM